MPSANKTQTNLTSTMLVVPSQEEQLAALITYLNDENLIKASLKQARAGSLHNLQLYNQDQEGLKIKTVREIIDAGSFGSYDSKLRVFAILNAQQASIPAQNALLKIIEEPPANSLVILVTAYPKQLLPTIHSRCLKVNSQPSTTTKNKRNVSKNAVNQIYSEETTTVAQQLLGDSFNLDQAIELAANYKKREQGLDLTEKLINYLHQQLSKEDQSYLSSSLSSTSHPISRQKITNTLEELLKAHQGLLKNLNPQLTLENHFFKIARYRT